VRSADKVHRSNPPTQQGGVLWWHLGRFHVTRSLEKWSRRREANGQLSLAKFISPTPALQRIKAAQTSRSRWVSSISSIKLYGQHIFINWKTAELPSNEQFIVLGNIKGVIFNKKCLRHTETSQAFTSPKIAKPTTHPKFLGSLGNVAIDDFATSFYCSVPGRQNKCKRPTCVGLRSKSQIISPGVSQTPTSEWGAWSGGFRRWNSKWLLIAYRDVWFDGVVCKTTTQTTSRCSTF